MRKVCLYKTGDRGLARFSYGVRGFGISNIAAKLIIVHALQMQRGNIWCVTWKYSRAYFVKRLWREFSWDPATRRLQSDLLHQQSYKTGSLVSSSQLIAKLTTNLLKINQSRFTRPNFNNYYTKFTKTIGYKSFTYFVVFTVYEKKPG